jgi:hypothetical protein
MEIRPPPHRRNHTYLNVDFVFQQKQLNVFMLIACEIKFHILRFTDWLLRRIWKRKQNSYLPLGRLPLRCCSTCSRTGASTAMTLALIIVSVAGGVLLGFVLANLAHMRAGNLKHQDTLKALPLRGFFFGQFSFGSLCLWLVSQFEIRRGLTDWSVTTRIRLSVSL